MANLVEVVISAKNNASGPIKQVSGDLKSLDGTGSKLGGALTGVATKLAVVGTVAGGAAAVGLGAIVKTSMDFSHQMSDVGAATQATGEDLAKLRGLALSLGKDMDLSGVDATEAAKAIAELGRGGVSTGDLLDGAAKGGLLLFSAGAKSVESASGVAVAAMSNFGLEGKQVGHIADVIAAGANKSATSVDELGQAFNMSAAVASSAGLSLEELTGTLSFLAQKGLQGSDAGTSLKTALQRLQAPTDIAANLMEDLGINVRDAEGHMLPMADIADVLKERLGGLSDAQRDAALETIFGADAIRVALPLIEGGGDAIREWTTKVDDAGYAARIGKQKNDDLFGSFEQLKATIATGAIEIGQRWEPAIRRATDAGTKFIGDVLDNPAVQKGLDDLATKGADALDRLIAKLRDPAFQAQMKEWGQAALDTGKAVVSLAGDVRDTLGPIVTKAADWFSDLNEGSKKNVVTFGLVAGSALAFRSELSSLLSVGKSVIGMFAAKEAAKKTLTAANTTLAGSASKTATAMQALKGVLSDVLVVLVAAELAVRALTHGQEGVASVTSSLVKYGDVLHTGREEALEFLAAHRDLGTLSAYDQEIAKLEQHYRDLAVESAKVADPSLAALKDLLTGTATARNLDANNTLKQIEALRAYRLGVQEASFAEEQHLRIQAGLAGVVGPFTRDILLQANGVGQLSVATNALAMSMGLAFGPALPASIGNTAQATNQLAISMGLVAAPMPLIVNGMNAGALAAGNLAVPVKASALAMLELNTYGTSAQSSLNDFGSKVLASILHVQGLESELGRLATTFANNELQMKSVGAESGQLGGWLQTLQGEWDKLDQAVQKQGFTTDAQKQRYSELAPLIQYLNAQQGTLHATTVGLTEQQVKNWQTIQTLNAAVAEGGAKAQGASSALAIMGKMTDAATQAASGGVGTQNAHAAAMAETQGAAVKAAGSISSVGAAIKMVPTSFTVTAHVDISAAVANINTLSNMIPRSPAKEGPFRVLPNWQAIYEGLAPAGAWASSTMGQTLEEMAGQLEGLESRLSGIGSQSSKMQGWLTTLQGANGAEGDPSGDSVEAIAFLNAELAKNAAATKQTTIEAVRSYQAWLKLGGQVDDAGKAAGGATQPVESLGRAIAAMPPSFKVIGNVDVQPGLDAIGLLAASLPTPTASKGPLAELPDWGAIFQGLPIVATTAGATTLAAMQATLGHIPDDLAAIATQMYGTGQELVANLAAGFTEAAPGVHTLATSLGADTLAEFRKYDERAKEAGKQLFGEVHAGLQEVAPGIATMVSTLAADVAKTTRQVTADIATMTAQFGTSGVQATETKAKATEITHVLGDGLSVFDKLIPLKDKPTKVLHDVWISLEDTLAEAGALADRADALKEEGLAFLADAQAAASAFEKGLALLGGIGGKGGANVLVDQAPGVAGGTFTLPGLPGRALGGPVMAGQMYEVGERGREYFIPRQSGTIVPGGNMGGGGGTTNHIYITVQGSVISEGQLVEKVRTGLLQKGRTVPTLGFN